MKDIFAHIQAQTEQFLDSNPRGIILVRGPTATGKTAVSLELAKQFR
ncbi:MAG: hypothetical protein H6765_00520 [Candidatus Peribacteria bacterium]|nr:MAG: hypothetical protein H6765_00520 [Candidatus Peribacteria bacterium]